jgi:hypothetical protein
MLLVFFILVIIIVLIATTELRLCVSIKDMSFKSYLKIYVLKSILIAKIDLTKKRKKYIKNKRIRKKFKNLSKNKTKFIKEIYFVLKDVKLNLKKLDFKIDISTTDCILTSYTVFILSNIIAFFIKFTNVKINLKNFKYMINPLYVNQKILNIKLDCIITTNLVHIISILYKNLKKWRCDVDGNETSNRWSYGNCDEQYKRNDRCKYNNRRSNTSTK